ncbi:chromosome transmission fidelity protein 1 [Cladophialophora yegresii CBS 114405]|uniref:ATP-dependent DNA helicase CHL1 n=1 Tax=Cladophialophora yegresii CBS 114405 TaxID=1182544 RepID=W9W5F2_9EURO|nr:chromosome transmission fidelity protein 1 [Cladophialophora yegresii CBS 114405]EXJ59766.1 chromosome transmission fidelity protein 1 [Cladophialophora yegresii CBS 114405]
MEPSQANFCHPYQPYSIQLEFMQSLYRCIEEKQVGIFESPTGTGKSLSLICGALTWLRDHERQSLQGSVEPSEKSDWLAQAEHAAQRRELLVACEELEHKLARVREEEARRRRRREASKGSKKVRIGKENAGNALAEDEFMLNDYDSDRETTSHLSIPNDGFSSATQALLDKLQAPAKKEVEEGKEDRLKIIFCSRTHSQLTQFVNELRRVKPPSSIPADPEEAAPESHIEEGVKHLTLGSRKNLCINPKVERLSSTTAINEQCLELQKPGIPKDKKCPFLGSKDDMERVEAFRDRVVADIKDIEDMGKLGREMELCPYYASRSAITMAEVLTLPYPLLLQKSAREALGVSVKDNVVIIDEAHNLIDAIAATLSTSLRLSQIEQAVQQVTAYAMRFKARLKGKNRVYVMQVIRVLNSMTDCLRATTFKPSSPETTLTAAQLMSGKGVDQIKPHKLLHYLHESKLCHKVDGYAESQSNDQDTYSKGVLIQFQNFLAVLMNPDEEGRFFASRHDKDVSVRYTLLDPREHFRDVVENARAVILAGGTMSPMSDYSDYLFSYLQKTRLSTFSFGHVIPASNLLAQAIVKGPSDVEFDFTFDKRGSEKIMVDLGRLILKACKVVRDGVVVFFPSYDYLAQVVSVWQRLPAEQPIMTALNRVKPIFQESKSLGVDEVLRSYATAIDTGQGGLMLSVMGGKLSEGINFSDKLGRAVISVGLPFPNANGAEWKAKLQHIADVRYQQCKKDGKGEADCQSAAKSASRDYYENACMRSVNQSIGRAIRHRNDYAAILMVDRRFATERIRRKLPGWIQESMAGGVPSWLEMETRLQQFFRGKQ